MPERPINMARTSRTNLTHPLSQHLTNSELRPNRCQVVKFAVFVPIEHMKHLRGMTTVNIMGLFMNLLHLTRRHRMDWPNGRFVRPWMMSALYSETPACAIPTGWRLLPILSIPVI